MLSHSPHCIQLVSREIIFEPNMFYNGIVSKILGNWKEIVSPPGPRLPRCEAASSGWRTQSLGVMALSFGKHPFLELLPLSQFWEEKSEKSWVPLTPERLILAPVGSVQQHYFNPVHVEQSPCHQRACQGHDGAEQDVYKHHWGKHSSHEQTQTSNHGRRPHSGRPWGPGHCLFLPCYFIKITVTGNLLHHFLRDLSYNEPERNQGDRHLQLGNWS